MTSPLQPSPNPRSSRWLWAAVIGTPSLWVLQLILNHVLTPSLCEMRRIWVLHAITGLFFVLSGIAVIACARDWNRLANMRSRQADQEEIAQAQFVAVVGVMTSTFFWVLILASGVPALVVDPCQDRAPDFSMPLPIPQPQRITT
jgi:hypothetical protein